MKFFKNKLAVTVSVLSVGFLILIFFSVRRGNASFVENGVNVTFNSVQGIVYKSISNTKDLFGFITHFSEIKQENENLKKQNAEMQGKVAAYDNLYEESQTLRDMLKFKDLNNEYNYQGADISGRSGGDVFNSYTLNKGKKDGVKVDMPVVSQEGFLVGQITATSDDSCQVQTITNVNISVSIENQTTGVIEGNLQGYTDISNKQQSIIYNLPQDTQMKAGNEIITSGVGNIYPKNLRIGKVLSIEDNKATISKSAVVEPYVNFSKLKYVLIVIPKDTSEIKY